MAAILSAQFGQTAQGQRVTSFQLRNHAGMTVRILDLGGIIQSVAVPDGNGKETDVVLGYDDLASYENGMCFYGAFIGRYANRIRGGHFVLDGKTYELGTNSENGQNHLHGVFGKRVFDASEDGDALLLRYFSPDMEEGYPGNLSVEIRCRLREDSALELDYTARTDAPTVLNLTNHSYFNLNGQDGSTILNHKLRLNSSYYSEIDESFAQTGRLISVENTPFDFRQEHTIGSRIHDEYPTLRACAGYDHNMVLDGAVGELKQIGTVIGDRTGICMEAFTTEPAMQFYCGNFIDFDPTPFGKNGVRYPKHGGFCMEAQHYPDSVNHPNFPSTVLRPGEIYRQTTVYRFSRETMQK